jgi:hypothetical protein
MDDINPATASTRVAIEFLTLWMESGDTARLSALQYIQRVLNEPDGPSAMSVISGLLNLSMFLLYELAEAQGAEDLQQRANEYLRNLSAQLPE